MLKNDLPAGFFNFYNNIKTPFILPYKEYLRITQQAADVNNASALLAWDQETYMPPKAAEFRGQQLATLAGISHELLTRKNYQEILETLSSNKRLKSAEQENIRLSQEDFDKSSLLPGNFVEALTAATSIAFHAWIAARKANDFSVFAPELKKMIALKKQQSAYYNMGGHPYDALLDDYEKGLSVALLDPVFATIREQLPPLMDRIRQAQQVDDHFFRQHFPRDGQWEFSLHVLRKMGYDFEAGRQDYSEHPFTTSFAPTDVRITTRVDEQNFASLLWSTIHEGGHALYEQGLPEDQYGLPLGQAASLSIHESQSRLWENCVGRGEAFWQHFYPLLQHRFPEQLTDVSPEKFYAGMNRVAPSLIRTEADELTYHFHVMIRYEIEKGLLEDSIEVEDLPAIWNELYNRYLSVSPKDYNTGILQDVHWSHGSFGYFPTYTLGSFYAAQFYAQALKELPGLEADFIAGNFERLLAWLRGKVHAHGRQYRSEELCERITGKGLDVSVFMQYATQKISSIYDLK